MVYYRMNYQVLARKWRPHNFTEVVGQEHVVVPLINALQHNWLHHAYLFTGTRGVGKTTLARILAKAINCENLKDANPCGECRVCQDIDEGRFLDLLEVDAASRTKVEDTRDLLDNAQYAPSQARYKVYLIDEVHMLSGHSFNALLKTLEEPPLHVKFLLATTDPQKIPVTVLSRCLQFNLKRLKPSQIQAQMQYILTQEAIAYELNALKLLAYAADGSMRDGLSLLDQAIVFGNGHVNEDCVNAMLGYTEQQTVLGLLSALADGQADALFALITRIAEQHVDFSALLQQIIKALHRIALLQFVPTLCDADFDGELYQSLTSRLSFEDVQLYYQIALLGQKDLDLTPDVRSGFEMLMLRMLAFKPIAPMPVMSKAKPLDKPSVKPVEPAINHNLATQGQAGLPETSLITVSPDSAELDWADMISAMKLESITKQLAQNCRLEHLDDQNCSLLLDQAQRHLLSPMREQKLQAALQAWTGKTIKLKINLGSALADTPAAQLIKQQEDLQQAAVDAIQADTTVQLLQQQFDAKIIPGTIKPV